ncbi:rRNA maturation RNase YbeY [Candidatus Roizmanbacteria bacterium RIFCSPHIGHO2_02_FULL_40_13b]|uniref:rRNA maturation RNase YbeY n=1 Tax=Candidatus Roizmanbacteria bacterium RIFCSPHIGHO2_01_FULL_39_24 TaxID=1802032 RepID=A0A1F7GE76_9BACT|nr:MAG: rRNA maturation RNase YbeY [Candidatus Roizmanbacteria bacterium RIFCSPHIGHO2_01_FULL_39_24]OGK26213.1 MAG: rRNA maturation RNase YbeY [Candidatus Roizmanbacteria bacterium RIFCSPHIGHO2_02_FULL_40_13b]OGK50365.1 MAG: rRNA maturation RNase YbeY [Candidatus Roizmanbacteria bacterium RIFCSPLOWO2_01_FULL_40_32]OGK56209.1 MAG: rRNA maturation RNase YbeY [Candidatus Roizmanbacteria bacterium RIFCSPLOWO2_02_FULL_39_8]
MITITTGSRYKVDKTDLINKTTDILKKFGIARENNLNIIFVGKRKMREIASRYKNEDVALPILSFGYGEKGVTSSDENTFGEIVICYPQAVLLAAQKDKTVEQILLWLIEHGLENILYK